MPDTKTAPTHIPTCLQGAGDDTLLAVRVIPRAGRTELAGARGDALLVRLAAAPVDGAANAALTDVIAEWLELPRRQVTLVAGDRSRDKRLRLEGLAPLEAARRLRRLVAI